MTWSQGMARRDSRPLGGGRRAVSFFLWQAAECVDAVVVEAFEVVEAKDQS
jgi:hypothetical protein